MSGAAEPSTEGEAGPSAEGRRLVLDIGGTKIAAGVCTPGQPSVRHRATRPTRPHRGGAAVAETALELAREVARKAGGPLAGVAAASAGVIDRATGTVASATDLMPGWAGTALGPALAEGLGVPAFVLNDVHAHALGEMRFGAGAGLRNALVAAVGTGIGGAIVAEGKVLFGPRDLAGHVGHVGHRLGEGFACSCGRDGHIEPVASGTGVVRLYRSRGGSPDVNDGAELRRLADRGDAEARRAFSDAGAALGEVLGSLANCLDPEAIVLSGSLSGVGEYWWAPLRAGYRRQAMDPVRGVPLVPGKLGGDAPLLGALAYAAEFQEEECTR